MPRRSDGSYLHFSVDVYGLSWASVRVSPSPLRVPSTQEPHDLNQVRTWVSDMSIVIYRTVPWGLLPSGTWSTTAAYVALLMTVPAHLWMASTPLAFGGPNVWFGGLATILAISIVVRCHVNVGRIVPITVVSGILLVWMFLVHSLTDTLGLTRIAQGCLGIGVMGAVFLSVSTLRRAILLIAVITLGTAVSALFGLLINYVGEPFLTVRLALTGQDPTSVLRVLGGRTAGIATTIAIFGYQISAAIPMAVAMLIYNPVRDRIGSRVWDVALYVVVIILLAAAIVNASRSVLISVFGGIVVVIAFAMLLPRTRQRVYVIAPLILIGTFTFVFVNQLVHASSTGPERNVEQIADEIIGTVDISDTTDGTEPLVVNQPVATGEVGNSTESRDVSGTGDSMESRNFNETVDNTQSRDIGETINRAETREVSETVKVADRDVVAQARRALIEAIESNDRAKVNELVDETRDLIGPEDTDRLLTQTLSEVFTNSDLGSLNPRVLSLSDQSARVRIPMMVTAIRYGVDNPFGTGKYEPDLTHVAPGTDDDLVDILLSRAPHNQFLLILVFYGIPGLVLITVLYGLVVRSLLSSTRSVLLHLEPVRLLLLSAVVAAVLSFVVNSMFQPHGPFFGDWYHFILLGLALSVQSLAGFRSEFHRRDR